MGNEPGRLRPSVARKFWPGYWKIYELHTTNRYGQ
jgi:hypothetical protein